jgi:POT family proton-dependent oligopeptide transporter
MSDSHAPQHPTAYTPPIYGGQHKIPHSPSAQSTTTAILFIALCEFFERMGYYGFRAVLVLYMTDFDVGLGMETAVALSIYAYFTMSVYFAPFPISFLIDLVLGPRRSVLVGGVVCALGLGIVAFFDEQTYFIVGLVVTVLGVALIKPALTTMIAKLFHKQDRDRDAAFLWFYMAINAGALVAGLFIAFAGQVFGWHVGFIAASLCYLIPVLIIAVTYQSIQSIEAEDEGAFKVDSTGRRYLDTGVLASRALLAFIVAVLITLFWSVFELTGGLLNSAVYEVKVGAPSFWYSLNGIFLLILLPITAVTYYARNRAGRPISSILSIGIGMLILSLGMLMFLPFATHMISGLGGAGVLGMVYLLHVIAEIFVSPLAISYITRLAPVKFTTVFIAGFFLITGFGVAYIGDATSFLYDKSPGYIVTISIVSALVIGILVVVFKPLLERLGHGIK